MIFVKTGSLLQYYLSIPFKVAMPFSYREFICLQFHGFHEFYDVQASTPSTFPNGSAHGCTPQTREARSRTYMTTRMMFTFDHTVEMCMQN